MPGDDRAAGHHANAEPTNPNRCALARQYRNRYERRPQVDPNWLGELRRQQPVLHRAQQQDDDHGSGLCPDKD
ncbi:hypothetical protein AL047_00865 [Pseudomonas syringae pv. broussonetiae]|nr:hypothetical protein [Pseudomonas amygdali]KWT08589.1 hypothetical protein AL047_00865 [Pseudomonas syringae pv. broussonetiae]